MACWATRVSTCRREPEGGGPTFLMPLVVFGVRERPDLSYKLWEQPKVPESTFDRFRKPNLSYVPVYAASLRPSPSFDGAGGLRSTSSLADSSASATTTNQKRIPTTSGTKRSARRCVLMYCGSDCIIRFRPEFPPCLSGCQGATGGVTGGVSGGWRTGSINRSTTIRAQR